MVSVTVLPLIVADSVQLPYGSATLRTPAALVPSWRVPSVDRQPVAGLIVAVTGTLAAWPFSVVVMATPCRGTVATVVLPLVGVTGAGRPPSNAGSEPGQLPAHIE